MTLGLPMSQVVNVTINMSPIAARVRDFGTLMVVGDAAVIDVVERMRLYSTLEEVAADFGTLAKEYTAAALYFGQSPRPTRLYIARWAPAGSAALLKGGILNTAQQALANFTAITTGTLDISIDGTALNLTAINFSTATNLNGVASLLTTKLGAAGVCTWDAVNGRFLITSATSGITSTITVATAGAVATSMGLTAALNATPINGIAAETPDAAVALLGDKSGDWYGCMFSTTITDDQHVAVATYIQAATPTRIYGVGVQSTVALNAGDSTDLGSRLKQLALGRTFTAYSSSQPLLVASVFGRAFTVNFEGSRTTITLKFKQLPGVSPELLTTQQAKTLAAKNYNIFVNYANGTAILQEGVMANGDFFDERHGLDWLQNDIETRVFNRLYTSTTKVPQTNAGQTDLMTVVEEGLGQAVDNGLIAPGRWTADGFGQLARGDMLPKGYYVYSEPVEEQSQADREARKAMPIQCAIKLAGAVHFVDVAINVNR